MSSSNTVDLEKAVAILNREWDFVSNNPNGDEKKPLDVSIVELIEQSINSPTKTFRYVLPTQLLAKLVDANLDARCVQAKRGGKGAFDARSVAHEVIVPFDRRLHNVLGGSTEPYVSKPLRCEAITPEFARDKRDRTGWAALCRILESVEEAQTPTHTLQIFRRVLQTIAERLTITQITYPVPNRTSLNACLDLIRKFQGKKTGGIRFESLVAALFQTLGDSFSLFSNVRRSSVNSADSQSGMTADLECVNAEGRIITVVEAKDRQISIRHIEDKLPALRAQGVAEAFFLMSSATRPNDWNDISELIRREFAAGHNLYVLSSDSFIEAVLALLKESGRRQFLQNVGKQLDEFGRLEDRQDWAAALQSLRE